MLDIIILYRFIVPFCFSAFCYPRKWSLVATHESTWYFVSSFARLLR